jgi:hypothetical protein
MHCMTPPIVGREPVIQNTPTQVSCQTVFRSGLRRQIAACRALAGIYVAVLAVGCGDVHFVPAPYTPQNVEVLFSSQEDITIIRWRVSAPPPVSDTTFQLLGPNGYESIDFSQSAFPGGVNACTDGHGACAQYVVRGAYAFSDSPHPVRAVHSTYGELPGGPATPHVLAQTLGIQSFFAPKNTTVYVNMNDAVAAGGPYLFPRQYERAMWATTGLCVSDSTPTGVSFSPLDLTAGFPPEQPLTDSGIYCVAGRPIPADAGAAEVVETRVATVPEVETREQVFQPPIERAPILYQIVLDLEIPVPDRCASAIQTIEAMVAKYLQVPDGTTPVPVYKLPTINLSGAPSTSGESTGCAQTTDRSLPAADLAQTVKSVVATYPQTVQQFHFLYFNNLDAPWPSTLTDSLKSLFDALGSPPSGYALTPLPWLFNPLTGGVVSMVVSGLNWWTVTPWLAADDPNFEQALAMYQPTLPYTTQIHDQFQPVPLLSSAEAAQRAGQLIKICASSPGIEPWSTLNNAPFPQPSWPIAADDPPAYEVSLPPEYQVPASSFVPSKAIVDYQICTRYCTDHGYLTDAGAGVMSWATSPLCAGRNY